MKTKEMVRFGNICMKKQSELKRYLYSVLKSNGYSPISEDGFLYAKGSLPYLVTAHMDTVHKVQCDRYSIHKYKGKHRIQSKDGIGGDDRCGVWMIVRMVLDGYRPSILFCEDEEIGSIGASKFCKTKYIDDLEDMRYLIELDRANENDAVFYDCNNPEFTEFITETTGYVESMGSFSDIVELSDNCGIASVNLSCGYYKAHTTSEYVIFEEMENTLKVVEKLLRTECKQFKFIRRVYSRWFDEDDWIGYNYYGSTYGKSNTKKATEGMEILYNKYLRNSDGSYSTEEEVFWATGNSELECLGMFFVENPGACYSDIIDYYSV